MEHRADADEQDDVAFDNAGVLHLYEVLGRVEHRVERVTRYAQNCVAYIADTRHVCERIRETLRVLDGDRCPPA